MTLTSLYSTRCASKWLRDTRFHELLQNMSNLNILNDLLTLLQSKLERLSGLANASSKATGCRAEYSTGICFYHVLSMWRKIALDMGCLLFAQLPTRSKFPAGRLPAPTEGAAACTKENLPRAPSGCAFGKGRMWGSNITVEQQPLLNRMRSPTQIGSNFKIFQSSHHNH